MPANADNDDNADPVYTAKIVSKPDPAVSTSTDPDAGAAQTNHTDAPSDTPACTGSPASNVAPTFDPDTDPDDPLNTCADPNMSFAGAASPDALPIWNASAVISAATMKTRRPPRARTPD